MKGFLTFTLAAGVAITTTSVAQAEGVTKGPAIAVPTTLSAPGGFGSMGVVLDRSMLVRELERLSQGPDQMNDAEDTGGAAPVRTKVGGSWAW